MSNKWFDPQLLEIFEGETIYYHAANCPSFCDFACNGMVGSLVAEAYNEAVPALRAQLAASQQETRDALAVVDAARKLVDAYETPDTWVFGDNELDDIFTLQRESLQNEALKNLLVVAAALRTAERK